MLAVRVHDAARSVVLRRTFATTLAAAINPNSDSAQRIQRTGALARKVGMVSVFDRWGVVHSLTELKIDLCQVTQVKTEEKEGYNAVQVGGGAMKLKRVTKPMFYHFSKAGVWPKQHLCEFRVSPDALLPVGTEIFARHFVPGQFVDVAGISKGKGFQGAMKRWGFSGMPASHGNSKTHRSIGSASPGQDPGRVWPGKKMAGHMGNQRRTVHNLVVYKVDCINNSVFVMGAVPGPAQGWVMIRDAVLKKPGFVFPNPPPFPTFVPQPGDETVKMLEMPAPAKNPLAPLGMEVTQDVWEWWDKKMFEGVDTNEYGADDE